MQRKLRNLAGALVAATLATLCSSPPAHATLGLWKDSFEDNNTTGWRITQSVASITVDATQGYSGTHALKVSGSSVINQGAYAYSHQVPVDFTQDYTVQVAFKYTNFHWDRFLLFGHIRLLLDQPGLPVLYDPIGNNSFTGNQLSANSFQSYLASGTWGLVTVYCRPSLRKYWVFMDGTPMGSVTYTAGLVPGTRFYFEDNYSDTNFLTAWYDDFAVYGMRSASGMDWALPGLAADTENDSTVWAQPPDVPFHGQYQVPDCIPAVSEPNSPWRASGDNHRCVVASLAMVFNRFENAFPSPNLKPNGQEEIAAAANTNDRDTWNAPLWKGTMLSDGRRAAHFSVLTRALTGARANAPPSGQPKARGAFGYSWRSIGYSAVDSVWKSVAAQDTVDFGAGGAPRILESLVAAGYPVMVCFAPPADYASHLKSDLHRGEKDSLQSAPDTTAEGHCVVIIGYDNLGGVGGNPYPAATPAVLIHDPALGSYLWVTQQYFFGQVWRFGKFLLAAPWEVRWLSPRSVASSAKFNGTALVTYTDPKPLAGCYPVTAAAQVAFNGIGLQGGEVATHNLANVVRSGDFDNTTWKLQAPAWLVVGGAWVASTGYGTLSSTSSTSYAGYADEIGATVTTPIGIVVTATKTTDLGIAGWPYGDCWWRGGTGGSGMQCLSTGGPPEDVSALVANVGQSASPPGSLLNFYAGEPCVTEELPGPLPIGGATVPTLAPGDTSRVHLLWAPPPENSMGESFFDLFAELLVPGDPPAAPWPQEENNYGVLADFPFDVQPGDSAELRFHVVNPESGPMAMSLVLAREAAAQHWDVTLTDSLGNPLPDGVPIPIGPGGSFQARAVVVPSGDDTLGCVHVEGWLYTTGSSFVREVGGVTLTVRWHPPAAGVGPRHGAILELAQNRPNPFVGLTTLRYSIPRDGRVSLRIYDVAGRVVRTLADGTQSAGPHDVVWDGTGLAGRLEAGLYFCRLEVPGVGGLTRKLVRLR